MPQGSGGAVEEIQPSHVWPAAQATYQTSPISHMASLSFLFPIHLVLFVVVTLFFTVKMHLICKLCKSAIFSAFDVQILQKEKWLGLKCTNQELCLLITEGLVLAGYIS
jgi:hypothetical protein